MPLFISKGGKKGHNNNKETSKAVILNKQKHYCDLIFLFGVINAFITLTRWRDQEISHSIYHLH